MGLPWWIPYAVVATLGWGLSFVFLPFVDSAGVSAYVTGTVLGGTMMVANLVAMAIDSEVTSPSFAEHWEPMQNWVVAICVVGFSLFYTTGEFAFLIGVAKNAPIALITAFTSIYPLVTIAGSLPIYRDWNTLDIRFLIPGAALAVGGVILLSFAKKEGVS